jgi:hypothetical protein
MAGALVDIGFRPKIVASFDPPDAEARFAEWRAANEGLLDGLAPDAYRVEYGRSGSGLYVRVRIDESHLAERPEAG